MGFWNQIEAAATATPGESNVGRSRKLSWDPTIYIYWGVFLNALGGVIAALMLAAGWSPVALLLAVGVSFPGSVLLLIGVIAQGVRVGLRDDDRSRRSAR